MKKNSIIWILFALLSCKKEEIQISYEPKTATAAHHKTIAGDLSPNTNPEKNTIRERFVPPQGYQWIESKNNSYGHFIENFKLKKYGAPILKYNGEKIANQNLHEAVFDISVGDRDLQQCADAIIRLRSEYLFRTQKFGEIKYHFTSGDLFTWDDYKNGMRAFVNGNSVRFRKTETVDGSYQNLINYLQTIYNYAGTISQFRETMSVTKNSDLKTGDILITAGSPGHVVFIAGVSKNSEGKKRYLLGEGFTPAQSISVMKNPYNPKISPWYELDVNSDKITTSRYRFEPVNFRRYP